MRAQRARTFGRRRRSRGWLFATALVAAGAVAAILAATRFVADGERSETGPGPVHVQALGVNPTDSALFIATHTGLFRLEPDAERAERVGDRHQDTMGFTVAGPDHFLGSGHPDLRDELPPLLGLIESRDGGQTYDGDQEPIKESASAIGAGVTSATGASRNTSAMSSAGGTRQRCFELPRQGAVNQSGFTAM